MEISAEEKVGEDKVGAEVKVDAKVKVNAEENAAKVQVSAEVKVNAEVKIDAKVKIGSKEGNTSGIKSSEESNDSLWTPQVGQLFESLEAFENLLHLWAHKEGFQLQWMQSRLEENFGQCPQ
ncbi:hypothetical protein BG006_001621, partial [Podila minutissima]